MFWKKTQQEKSEQQEELHLYKGLLESCSLPYYVRDMDYSIILWSTQMEQLTGYSTAEVLGKKCKDIFKTILCNENCPCTKCALDRTKFYDEPVTIYNKNGEAIPTLVSSAGVYDTAGDVLGCAEFIKDDRDYAQLHSYAAHTSQQSSILYTEINYNINNLKESTDSLSHALTETSSNTENCALASRNIHSASQHCTEHAQKVTTMLTHLEEDMQQVTSLSHSLEDNMQKIQSLSKQIEAISFQTNILAINASIESSRAGSYGKGFAVVAQSIKDLANTTAQLTKDIHDTIATAEQTAKTTTQHTLATYEQLEVCKNEIGQLNQEITSIDQQIDTVTQNIGEINQTAGALEHSVIQQHSDLQELSQISSQFIGLLDEGSSIVDGLKR